MESAAVAPVLAVEGLGRTYDGTRALAGLSFHVLAVVRIPHVAGAGYAAIAASPLALMVLHQLLRRRAPM